MPAGFDSITAQRSFCSLNAQLCNPFNSAYFMPMFPLSTGCAQNAYGSSGAFSIRFQYPTGYCLLRKFPR
ncbi:MAG: hypothetical protein ACYS9V_14880, partial [Planctomycetota bacterium]